MRSKPSGGQDQPQQPNTTSPHLSEYMWYPVENQGKVIFTLVYKFLSKIL
jgi:hypothetical protein